MSWTVACFCGTVFDAPADHCPTCHTPVPAVTRGVSAPMPLPDAVEDSCVRRRARTARRSPRLQEPLQERRQASGVEALRAARSRRCSTSGSRSSPPSRSRAARPRRPRRRARRAAPRRPPRAGGAGARDGGTTPSAASIGRPTWAAETLMPVSSRSSRTAASRYVSPSSMPPPGSSHHTPSSGRLISCVWNSRIRSSLSRTTSRTASRSRIGRSRGSSIMCARRLPRAPFAGARVPTSASARKPPGGIGPLRRSARPAPRYRTPPGWR